MSICTKEQLKTHIHKIHNLIRNSGAGYGMDALKLFNFFYGLKILEQYWEQFGLKSMKFSELVKLSKKTLNDESKLEILNELFNRDTDKDMKLGCLYEINQKNDLRNIFVTKINEGLKTNFYKQLILEINKIPTINDKKKSDIINEKFDVDIKGKTYEYFLGRDRQTISDLGSYFTDRHITKFTFDITKPELINGKLPRYIDPFGGSGGFTLSFINYIKNKYPDINWKSNIKSIRHYDMSEVVVKSCALETLAITGKIPNMNDCFQIGNSFKQDFGGHKYFNIYSNPPFGGNASLSSDSETYKLIDELKKRYYIKVQGDKGKELFKWTCKWAGTQYDELKKQQKFEIAELEKQQVNLFNCNKRFVEFCIDYDKSIDEELSTQIFGTSKEITDRANNFKIFDKCNDKEACSLIMFMELLDKDGTCAVVLKEGVFFDNKYSALRKCLVDKFNIERIISIPQDAFENTTTKTSIVIFKNSGQTKKIKFSELNVEKELVDVFEEIVVDGETQLELTIQRDQIIKVSDIEKVNATYEEISKSTLKTLSGKKSKQMWNYSLNWKDYLKDETVCPQGYKLVKMKDLFDYEPKSKRPASFANDEGLFRFYTSSDTIKKCTECDYKSKKPVLIFGTGGKGSLFIDNEFSCSADNFICLLKNEFTIEHTNYIYQYIKSNWKEFVFKMFNGSTLGHINQTRLNEYQIPIPIDISKFTPQLTKLSKSHDKISELTEQIPLKEKNICDEIKNLTENGIKGVDWDEYKLGDVCEVSAGKYLKSYIKGNLYPIIGGGDISGYINEYNNEDNWVIHKDGVSKKIISYVKGKFFLNHHGWIMKTIKNISKTYIGYYIINITNKIMESLNGTNQKGLNQDKFYSFKIRILKDKVLSKYKLQDKFDEVDKLKEELETTKKTYQEEINKLMEPFKIGKDDNVGDSDNESEQEDLISNKSSKSTKSSKSDNLKIPKELVEDLPKLSKSIRSSKSTKFVKQSSPEISESDEETESDEEEDKPIIKSIMTKSTGKKKSKLNTISSTDSGSSTDSDSGSGSGSGSDSESDKKVKKVIKGKINKAESSVQQINTHKKAKSNSKYIDNSDSDLDLDNLEKDLARKTK